MNKMNNMIELTELEIFKIALPVLEIQYSHK